MAAGRALPHHIFPQSAWVSFYIRSEEDVPGAVALLRRNYERWPTLDSKNNAIRKQGNEPAPVEQKAITPVWPPPPKGARPASETKPTRTLTGSAKRDEACGWWGVWVLVLSWPLFYGIAQIELRKLGISLPGLQRGWPGHLLHTFWGSRSLLVSEENPTDVLHQVDCDTGRETLTVPGQRLRHMALTGDRAEALVVPGKHRYFFLRDTYCIWDTTRRKVLCQVTAPLGPNTIWTNDFQVCFEDLSATAMCSPSAGGMTE